MNLTHIRTENGTPTLITARAALDEIETVMAAGDDDTEMYGSGSTYAITYPDGRQVNIRPATPDEIAGPDVSGRAHPPGGAVMRHRYAGRSALGGRRILRAHHRARTEGRHPGRFRDPADVLPLIWDQSGHLGRAERPGHEDVGDRVIELVARVVERLLGREVLVALLGEPVACGLLSPVCGGHASDDDTPGCNPGRRSLCHVQRLPHDAS